ncbi:IMC sub-compartment protein ISP2 [Besnoitia besnoiti]|uniref:IMC sub-compartment protein ISP2 n=1 Tax=Besnoitia besnoiti TaxID=94643 RepID=A0A2A9MA62_BESBE|nr:IMC sub-compartment protein ISP2 [Besnoitia besnoiti]PFH32282.1 IMC sub-compartment protein ISP2 [Besnoitia besnoiti]
MGNACKSCCGESADTQLEVEAPENGSKTSSPHEELLKRYTPDLLERLHKGLGIGLILQDKSRLDCIVKLTDDNSAIQLSCDRKSRMVKLSEIRNILYTPEQLKRVDCSAGISKSDYCVALHLIASGNCIPLFFADAAGRDCFVIVLEKLRDSLPAPSGSTSSS